MKKIKRVREISKKVKEINKEEKVETKKKGKTQDFDLEEVVSTKTGVSPSLSRIDRVQEAREETNIRGEEFKDKAGNSRFYETSSGETSSRRPYSGIATENAQIGSPQAEDITEERRNLLQTNSSDINQVELKNFRESASGEEDKSRYDYAKKEEREMKTKRRRELF